MINLDKNFTGHVFGVERPAYDGIVDAVLEKVLSPWGGGGSDMRVAICCPDGSTIYRVEQLSGMGEWMGFVLGLKDAGLIDLVEGQAHPQFDAIFAPSPALLIKP